MTSIETATVKRNTKIASFIENFVGKQRTKERKKERKKEMKNREKHSMTKYHVAMVCRKAHSINWKKLKPYFLAKLKL